MIFSPAERCLIGWDGQNHGLVNAELCQFADKDGDRIVHYAEFQANAVIREWSDPSAPAPEKTDIIRAIIAHSDLRAVNRQGQNALHTHAEMNIQTGGRLFFHVLREDPPEYLDDLLKARDHKGNTVLNAASLWLADEDDYLNFDLGLVRYLSREFEAIGIAIRDAVRCTVPIPNDGGFTPLMHYMSLISSASDIDVDYLRWLLEAGADLLTIDNCGRSLLHVCAETSTEAVTLTEFAQRAIDASAHPAQTDDFGQTALHGAACNPHCAASLIQMLSRHCTGVDPSKIKNGNGHSPVEIARSNKYHHIAHLIASATIEQNTDQ
ncbi:MAG TPA: hypothetical protein VL424_21655 [Pararobbsia sp.]|nr:hypothetical protein [Pararobbsia sp.]